MAREPAGRGVNTGKLKGPTGSNLVNHSVNRMDCLTLLRSHNQRWKGQRGRQGPRTSTEKQSVEKENTEKISGDNQQ